VTPPIPNPDDADWGVSAMAGDEAVRLAAELREHLTAHDRVEANRLAADLRALCAAIQTHLGGEIR
jgi:hypothetical protein